MSGAGKRAGGGSSSGRAGGASSRGGGMGSPSGGKNAHSGLSGGRNSQSSPVSGRSSQGSPIGGRGSQGGSIGGKMTPQAGPGCGAAGNGAAPGGGRVPVSPLGRAPMGGGVSGSAGGRRTGPGVGHPTPPLGGARRRPPHPPALPFGMRQAPGMNTMGYDESWRVFKALEALMGGRYEPGYIHLVERFFGRRFAPHEYPDLYFWMRDYMQMW